MVTAFHVSACILENVLFGKMSIQVLAHLFMLNCFWIHCMRFFFFLLYILVLIPYWIFHLLCKSFLFDVVPFVYFCFCFPCLRRYVQKILLRLMSKRYNLFQEIYGFKSYISVFNPLLVYF